jgi:hypothetical protein
MRCRIIRMRSNISERGLHGEFAAVGGGVRKFPPAIGRLGCSMANRRAQRRI